MEVWHGDSRPVMLKLKVVQLVPTNKPDFDEVVWWKTVSLHFDPVPGLGIRVAAEGNAFKHIFGITNGKLLWDYDEKYYELETRYLEESMTSVALQKMGFKKESA